MYQQDAPNSKGTTGLISHDWVYSRWETWRVRGQHVFDQRRCGARLEVDTSREHRGRNNGASRSSPVYVDAIMQGRDRGGEEKG